MNYFEWHISWVEETEECDKNVLENTEDGKKKDEGNDDKDNVRGL